MGWEERWGKVQKQHKLCVTFCQLPLTAGHLLSRRASSAGIPKLNFVITRHNSRRMCHNFSRESHKQLYHPLFDNFESPVLLTPAPEISAFYTKHAGNTRKLKSVITRQPRNRKVHLLS